MPPWKQKKRPLTYRQLVNRRLEKLSWLALGLLRVQSGRDHRYHRNKCEPVDFSEAKRNEKE